jgi:mannosylglucosylglycerate synthase
MKICLLHYSAPPIVGGVESVLGHHARLMVGHGQQVRIIAGRGQQMDERVEFVNVPIVDSRHPEVLAIKAELDAGRVPRGFDDLSERIAAQLLEAVEDADQLIAHNVCSLHKNLALTAALHRLSESHKRPRLILWHHDLAWTTPRYRPELHDGYPWDLLRTDWPWAQQVVVSESRRRELMELLGVAVERIHVVPNGVNLTEFLKLEARTQQFIAQLGLASAAPLILLPVRITPRKNIELALKVVAALRGQFPDVKLIVTGPLGPHNPANAQYFERLLAMRADLKIEGSAHFLAELSEQLLSDEVIADFYKMADLLFFPSREEGFGIPVLEAGLAGVPVFCTDIAPLRDLGGIDANYFSLDDNPDDIAEKISGVLGSSSVYALRKRVLQDYIWEQIYAKHIAPLLSEG